MKEKNTSGDIDLRTIEKYALTIDKNLLTESQVTAMQTRLKKIAGPHSDCFCIIIFVSRAYKSGEFCDGSLVFVQKLYGFNAFCELCQYFPEYR